MKSGRRWKWCFSFSFQRPPNIGTFHWPFRKMFPHWPPNIGFISKATKHGTFQGPPSLEFSIGHQVGVPHLLCRNPTLREYEDETHIPKMGTWESSGTPETSEFDCRGQNTLHWGILYNIEKLSKCRCRKWASMGHLDICGTNYGKKKGQELNWQFDSWPLKIGNRPDPRVCRWSVTHCWKALDENYKFASHLILIGGLSKELCPRKVPRVLLGNPKTKSHLVKCYREVQRILHGGRWWLPPSPSLLETTWKQERNESFKIHEMNNCIN